MMKIDIRLDIPPPRTTHQSGTRIARTGRTYKAKSLQEVEKLYILLLNRYRPQKPMQGAVHLIVEFAFKAPNQKVIGLGRTTRPDLDNMVKTLIDCMTKCGYWNDDNQIYWLQAKKIYGKEPYIHIQAESEEQVGDE